ncbi:uncharacterized protein BJX67DRAFT_372047 [Aspergillus lucknowensis]|uniref:Zn(2)-C6 fungal-type domain-containing protein n=1 Tax=Aspergillus lucknowensis TaxID=176173 RepID=A0ABR4LSE2_9EURO
MPVHRRRLRRSLLECARCAQGQMDCSMARPRCDECKSQRLSGRYADQRPSKPRTRPFDSRSRRPQPSLTSESSLSSLSSLSSRSSPSPPSSSAPAAPSAAARPPSPPTESKGKDEGKDEGKDDGDGLLNNWKKTTELSLSPSKSKDRSWQSLIRRLTPSCPALHHSTLALSAIQLAASSDTSSDTSTADRKHHTLAARRHYNQAIDTFPVPDDTPSVSKCNAAFSTASLLFLCDLASSTLDAEDWQSSPPSDTTTAEDDAKAPSLQRLLKLFRTIRGLVPSPAVLDKAENGELKALFTHGDPYHQLPSTYTLTILSMRNLNTATTKSDPSHEAPVYEETIKHLDKSLEMLSKGGEPTMIALRWMFRVPSRYLDLVEERQPLALIIFAHYCAVLHHLRDRWWMDDLGARLVKEISQLLDPSRICSILWASDIVGI